VVIFTPFLLSASPRLFWKLTSPRPGKPLGSLADSSSSELCSEYPSSSSSNFLSNYHQLRIRGNKQEGHTSMTDSILSFSVIPEKSPLLNASYFLAFISIISLLCSALGPSSSSWNIRFLESCRASAANLLTKPGEGLANGSFTYHQN
jgi:hypothetical protein